MKKLMLGAFLLWAYGCSSDDSGSDANGGAPHSGGAGVSTAGAGSHAGGNGSVAGGGPKPSAEAGAAGDGLADAGASDGGAAGSSSPGEPGAAGSENPPATCSAARAQLLGSIDSVSTGDVTVISNASGVATLYVGATAGGITAQASNPWLFVSLDTSSKVLVTDVSSVSSSAWDLALKRPLLYTNSGDGGPGEGGAVLIDKDFDAVTAADATKAAFTGEKFFDDACNPILDPTGAALTSFSNWYDYDSNTHALSPHPGTWLVHGATGKLFKLQIKTYYGTPTGGTGMAGGAYVIEVGAL